MLQVVDLVICLALAGNPAIAQAKVDGLLVSQRRNARFLFRDLQPDPGSPLDVVRKPRFKVGGVTESDDLGRAWIRLS